jgi:hypothetical protein
VGLGEDAGEGDSEAVGLGDEEASGEGCGETESEGEGEASDETDSEEAGEGESLARPTLRGRSTKQDVRSTVHARRMLNPPTLDSVTSGVSAFP